MRRKRIGLYISYEHSEAISLFINAVSSVCIKNDIELLVFPHDYGISDLYNYQQRLILAHYKKENLDGFLFVPLVEKSSSVFDNDIIKSENDELKIVSVLTAINGITSIILDEQSGVNLMVEHLEKVHACKKINLVVDTYDSENYKLVLLYKQAFKTYGIHIENERIFYTDQRDNSKNHVIQYFISKDLLDCDVIIAFNNATAFSILKEAESEGIHIPSDFMIVSHRNVQSRITPEPSPLTSLTYDFGKIGQIATETLVKLLNEEDCPDLIQCKYSLCRRKSCGCVSEEDIDINCIDDNNKQILIKKSTYHEYIKKYYRLIDKNSILYRYFFDIGLTATEKQCFENFRKVIKELNFTSCVVVLFAERIEFRKKEPITLPLSAKIGFFYVKDKDASQYELYESIVFNPFLTVIPESLLVDRQHQAFIYPLFFCEYQLGYILFEPETLTQYFMIYEMCFSQLASSLNSVFLFMETKKSKRRLKYMLDNISATNEKLSRISLTDELTGLYNRRGLLTTGKQLIELTTIQNKPGVVIFADMDGLKIINDTYGHDYGDKSIKLMGKSLRKCFRDMDIIARIGGDEFVVISGSVGSDYLSIFRERLNKIMADDVEIQSLPFKLSISMGAVEFSQDKNDLESLLKLADQLLYIEKKLKKQYRGL